MNSFPERCWTLCLPVYFDVSCVLPFGNAQMTPCVWLLPTLTYFVYETSSNQWSQEIPRTLLCESLRNFRQHSPESTEVATNISPSSGWTLLYSTWTCSDLEWPGYELGQSYKGLKGTRFLFTLPVYYGNVFFNSNSSVYKYDPSCAFPIVSSHSMACGKQSSGNHSPHFFENWRSMATCFLSITTKMSMQSTKDSILLISIQFWGWNGPEELLCIWFGL